MKRYITYDPFAEGVGSVTGIYVGAIPESITGGIESESPTPDIVQITGLTTALRINIETGELYFDYISVESTESKLATTQAELTQVQQALADTYEQLALTQIENTNTQAAMSDLYEQLILVQAELAALKGGE